MPLYILRHGETEWNRDRRFQGALDSPLTEKGRDQARRFGLALRQRLGPATPVLVSSPLGRTLETTRLACAAAGWNAESCRLDPDIQEVSLGEYDGLTRDDVPDFDTLAAQYGPGDSLFFHCPGGERWPGVMDRLARAAQRFDPAAETVIFTHGVAGKMLRGHILGLDRVATMALNSPQDAFFRLHAGETERIPAATPLLP